MSFKKIFGSWHMWIMVLLVVGLFFYQKGSGSVSSFLPYLLILACPLMMMFMMGSHDDHTKHKK